jgi:D-sedoheptulose 7-phosphate isomerase
MINYIEELTQTLSRLDIAPLLSFVQACQGTLWLAGNGGSASTAQHWACDLSKQAGWRVQALGSNPAVLTAWANDAGYEHALASELLGSAHGGDALICLSCSGTSRNIDYAVRQAKSLLMPSALLTSSLYSGALNQPRIEPDLVVSVPHAHYGIIEDCHVAIGHWLTEALCSR